MFNIYHLLILLCLLVIASYGFNLLSLKTKLPAVLFLLITGMCLKILTNFFQIGNFQGQSLLELFGIVGLVLIVLEGSLELKINSAKIPLIRKAFLSAFGILLLTNFLIGFIIYYWFNTTFYHALVNALPLAVISSAIAIPSVSTLDSVKKEFIIYESTFSDILGIIVLDFLLHGSESSVSFFQFNINLILVIVLSVGSSLMLLWMLQQIKGHIKIFLILSVMMLIYAIAKLMHISSLLIVLVFGILLNNYSQLNWKWFRERMNFRILSNEIRGIRKITHESAFIIRTFFFVLLGFSVEINDLLHPKVVTVGLIITGILLFSRYLGLRFIGREHLFPEVLIAPRGLITILLFYSLPQQYLIPEFGKDIVVFVVITTSICMSIGLLFSPKYYVEAVEQQV